MNDEEIPFAIRMKAIALWDQLQAFRKEMGLPKPKPNTLFGYPIVSNEDLGPHPWIDSPNPEGT